jgi:hypothetical protein
LLEKKLQQKNENKQQGEGGPATRSPQLGKENNLRKTTQRINTA